MGNPVLKIRSLEKKLKGQCTLETAIVFILIILFLGGITKIWLWANNQIVQRQLRYNASRVTAGTSTDTYTLQWPVYTPPNLTEDEVILNNPLDPG